MTGLWKAEKAAGWKMLRTLVALIIDLLVILAGLTGVIYFTIHSQYMYAAIAYIVTQVTVTDNRVNLPNVKKDMRLARKLTAYLKRRRTS